MRLQPVRGSKYTFIVCVARVILLTLISCLTGYSQTDVQVANERRITLGEAQQIKIEKSLTIEALRKIPQADIRELQLELQYPDLPFERAAFRALQLRDERGVIPANALPKALQQLDSLRVRAERASVHELAGMPIGSSMRALARAFTTTTHFEAPGSS